MVNTLIIQKIQVGVEKKYLSSYTGKDYETLYKQEALKTKDLEKTSGSIKKR